MAFVSWVVLAAALLLLFVFVLLAGISRKSVNMVILAVVFCVMGLGAAGVAVYKFIKESYHEIKQETSTPKTKEI
jgi:hypothetical protein